MNEANSPFGKRWPDMPETFSIPDQPDIPPGSEHHFSKERLFERLSGPLGNVIHVRTIAPINLQICPYSSTAVALKKEMVFVLQVMGGAEHTLRAILDMPVSSDNHVFCVEMIHDHQPGKNFGFQDAAGFPNPI